MYWPNNQSSYINENNPVIKQPELEYLTLLSSLPVANIAFFGCTANAQSSPSAWPFQSKTKSVTEPWFILPQEWSAVSLQLSALPCSFHCKVLLQVHPLTHFTTFFLSQIHALSTCPQYASHSYTSFLVHRLCIFLANKSLQKNCTNALHLIYRDQL